MTRSRLRIAAIHVALPLLLGALSYVVLREWAPLLGTHAVLWHAPRLLRDHFADAAWGWALGGFVAMMWFDQKRAHRVAWTLAAMFVAAGYELLQFTHSSWGRFDLVDLVVQTSAVVIAATIAGGNLWTTSKETR